MELVTIITTSYNTNNYIEDCLKSIYELTYPNLEFLIIDDGSTDGTWDKICEFQKKFKSRFNRLMAEQSHDRLGFAECVNRLIKMANGKYIKKVDADDMIPNDAIDKFVEFAENEKADIYFSNGYIVGKSFKFNDISKKYGLKKRYDIRQIDGNNITNSLFESCYISNPGTFIPKSTYEKYGLYDKRYLSEDYEYWLRTSSKGAKFKYVDFYGFYYRELPTSLSHFSNTKEENKRLYIYEKNKYDLLKLYLKYAKYQQKCKFFNTSLGYFLSFSDDEKIYEARKLMSENNIKLSNKNKIKFVLYKLKLIKVYKFLKDNVYYNKGKLFHE